MKTSLAFRGAAQRNGSQIVLAISLAVVLIGVALLYWPGLKGDLVVDDRPNLKPILDLEATAVTWQQLAFDNRSGPIGRPVSMLSFIADYFAGAGGVRQFKQTNLAIHLLCGSLLFWLCGRLYGRLNLAGKDEGWWYALIVASIWLTAPLLVSSVLYVVQRMTMLATLFSITGLLLYVIGREQIDRGKRIGFALISLCFFWALPTAVLSKENGAVLPLLALVIEVFWFQFRTEAPARRFLFALFAISLALPTILVAIRTLLDPQWLLAGYDSRDFSPSDRLLTQTRVLWDYLRQLLLPSGSNMGLFHDDFPLSRGLFDPITTALACLAWVLLIAFMFFWRGRRTVQMLGFGVAFFLAGHSIESTILPLEMYFEHRNYLPATGLLAGIVAAIAIALQNVRRSLLLIPLLAMVPVCLAFVARQQIIVWQSSALMARVAEHAHPGSPRLQTGLMMLYLYERNPKKAIEHIHQHARLTGGYSAGHAVSELIVHCAMASNQQQVNVSAILGGRRLNIDVFTSERLSDLLDLLDVQRCPNLAIQPYSDMFRGWASQIHRNDRTATASNLRFNLASLLILVGARDQAYQLLQDNDQNDPSSPESALLMIKCLLLDDRLDAAEILLEDVRRRNRSKLEYHAAVLKSFEAYIARRRTMTGDQERLKFDLNESKSSDVK